MIHARATWTRRASTPATPGRYRIAAVYQGKVIAYSNTFSITLTTVVR